MRIPTPRAAGWIFPMLGALACLAACEKPTKGSPAASASTPSPSATVAKPTAPTASHPATGGQDHVEKAAASVPDSEAAAAARATLEFGTQLFRQLPTKTNLAVSPASISAALGMTLLGAGTTTASEMAEALRFKGDAAHGAWGKLLDDWSKAGDTATIEVVNRLFGEKTVAFRAPFLSAVKERYSAPLELRDFRSAPEAQRTWINDWAKKNTQDRIVNLLPPGSIGPQTPLVLANALYFKATWRQTFNQALTAPTTFYANGRDEMKTPMMRHTGAYGHTETQKAHVVELPYQGDRFSMVIVVPKGRNGLANLEKNLNAADLSAWLGALKPSKVDLRLPKFTLKQDKSLSLVAPLKKLGIQAAFEQKTADFAKMADVTKEADKLFIDDVYHQSFVAIDETGTEAAAATAVVMGPRGAKPVVDAKVVADHPFLFLIRDTKTGALLFLGRVVEPTSA